MVISGQGTYDSNVQSTLFPGQGFKNTSAPPASLPSLFWSRELHTVIGLLKDEEILGVQPLDGENT